MPTPWSESRNASQRKNCTNRQLVEMIGNVWKCFNPHKATTPVIITIIQHLASCVQAPLSIMWFIARTVSSMGVVTSGLWQKTRSTYVSFIRSKAAVIPSTICFRESPRSFTPLPPSKSFVEMTRSDRITSPESKSSSSAFRTGNYHWEITEGVVIQYWHNSTA